MRQPACLVDPDRAPHRPGRHRPRVDGSTALQEQITPGMLSRVSAYDGLGSYALTPLGTLVAGPVAVAIGAVTTLAVGGGAIVVSALVVLCVGEVRNLVRRPVNLPADPGPPLSDAGP